MRLNTFKGLAVSLAALLLLASASLAQVPSTGIEYNKPMSNGAALITNTGRGASTVNTTVSTLNGAQSNLINLGVICTYNQVSHTGSPSTTIAIQYYDSASASYQSLVTSGAITADATPTSILVHPAIAVASLPSGMVSANLPLPRYWRLQEVVAGSATPTVTGTVGCDYLK